MSTVQTGLYYRWDHFHPLGMKDHDEAMAKKMQSTANEVRGQPGGSGVQIEEG